MSLYHRGLPTSNALVEEMESPAQNSTQQHLRFRLELPRWVYVPAIRWALFPPERLGETEPDQHNRAQYSGQWPTAAALARLNTDLLGRWQSLQKTC